MTGVEPNKHIVFGGSLSGKTLANTCRSETLTEEQWKLLRETVEHSKDLLTPEQVQMINDEIEAEEAVQCAKIWNDFIEQWRRGSEKYRDYIPVLIPSPVWSELNILRYLDFNSFFRLREEHGY